MRDGVECFCKVQQDNVALLALVNVSSKIFKSDKQLGFTRMGFMEAMLNVGQDPKFLEMCHDVAEDNVVHDLTGNRSEGDGSVVRGK